MGRKSPAGVKFGMVRPRRLSRMAQNWPWQGRGKRLGQLPGILAGTVPPGRPSCQGLDFRLSFALGSQGFSYRFNNLG